MISGSRRLARSKGDFENAKIKVEDEEKKYQGCKRRNIKKITEVKNNEQRRIHLLFSLFLLGPICWPTLYHFQSLDALMKRICANKDASLAHPIRIINNRSFSYVHPPLSAHTTPCLAFQCHPPWRLVRNSRIFVRADDNDETKQGRHAPYIFSLALMKWAVSVYGYTLAIYATRRESPIQSLLVPPR